jgi:hypothetical protein
VVRPVASIAAGCEQILLTRTRCETDRTVLCR